jgi:hypothetical protein
MHRLSISIVSSHELDLVHPYKAVDVLSITYYHINKCLNFARGPYFLIYRLVTVMINCLTFSGL